MVTPVMVQYLSKDEIERLMISLSASEENSEAKLFEAMVLRLLELADNYLPDWALFRNLCPFTDLIFTLVHCVDFRSGFLVNLCLLRPCS